MHEEEEEEGRDMDVSAIGRSLMSTIWKLYTRNNVGITLHHIQMIIDLLGLDN